MGPIAKTLVLSLGILASGAARMTFEQEFSEDLRERNLAPASVDLESWSRMGQSSLAGTFGGLRTAMAFFVSLSAHGHFQDLEWHELKNDYKLITSLDPYNSFYWSEGSHHLAFNAASWARSQRDQPEIQRRTIEREYLEAGDAFLKKGLIYLPDDGELWADMARIWSHRLKRPDPERALPAWQEAARLAQHPIYQRRVFYTMAQISGMEREALNYGIKLVKEEPRHLGIPSFQAIYWALFQNPELPIDMQKPALTEVFRSKEKAYRQLYNYYFRTSDEGFYAGNIEADLHQLIRDLQIPFQYNPFLSPRQRRIPQDF